MQSEKAAPGAVARQALRFQLRLCAFGSDRSGGTPA